MSPVRPHVALVNSTHLSGARPKPRFCRECWFFLLASLFDAFMTWLLLTHESGSFCESNPLALFFLNRFGFAGMLVFKTLLVSVVMVNYAIISKRRADVARRLMSFGTVVVNGVVLYSVFLLYSQSSL
jgi:hypothetical protein